MEVSNIKTMKDFLRKNCDFKNKLVIKTDSMGDYFLIRTAIKDYKIGLYHHVKQGWFAELFGNTKFCEKSVFQISGDLTELRKKISEDAYQKLVKDSRNTPNKL